MEGFQHTNFTSKHAVQFQTNEKRQYIETEPLRVPFIFKSGYHNVMKELEQRAKSEIPETVNSSHAINLDSLIESYLAQV